jgi:hypothetical protein
LLAERFSVPYAILNAPKAEIPKGAGYAQRAILIFAHIMGIQALTFVTERDQPDPRVVTNVQ